MSVGSGIRVALTFGPENRRDNLNLPGVGENLRLCTLLRTKDPPTPALPPRKTVGVAIFLQGRLHSEGHYSFLNDRGQGSGTDSKPAVRRQHFPRKFPGGV